MPCYHPLKAFITGDLTENGKQEYIVTHGEGTFLPLEEAEKRIGRHIQSRVHVRVAGSRLSLVDFVPVPCGKCIGCRLEYSRKWAVRSCLEAASHEDNSFITLTYDNENLPADGKLSKRPLQLFIKRLRKTGAHVRYLACGEYGERTHRPHFHLIAFGYCPSDLETLYTKDGITYYRSESLQKIWGLGNVLVGDMNFRTCAYVARYCMKKINDPDCFLLTSRKPGIGASYFFDNAEDIYKTDTIYFNFGDFHKAKPP